MEYTKITSDIKSQIIDQKLAALEQEHYALTITRDQLQNSKVVQAGEQIAQLEANLVAIEEAHDYYRQEQSQL